MRDSESEHQLGTSDPPHRQLLLGDRQPDAATPRAAELGSGQVASPTGMSRDCNAAASIPELAASASRAAGSCVVAAIGINRYAAWPHLGNAVNDARKTAAVFCSLGFTEASMLIDAAATGYAIRKLVTDDLGTLGVNDSLIVFFAGHGGTKTHVLEDDTKVKTGYIIPVDAENKQGQVSTWIRLDAWLADIARLPPKHILVILDACHSGIALDSLIRPRGAQGGEGDTRSALSRRRSRKVIVSALDDEVALDGGPKPGHSLFTGHLIEALTDGLGRDGRREASGSELGLHLQTRVSRYPNSRQTPSFGPLDFDCQGELMIPLLPAVRPSDKELRLSNPESPRPSSDVNASLRASLASTLAELVPRRAAIARLVSTHAPQLRVAELPAGTATMIWTCILVELTNSGRLSEISAIMDAAQQLSWRARRIDWSVFTALLKPPAVPVVVGWSHLALELGHNIAQADGDPALITRGDVLLEAIITQRWGGERPRDPLIGVTAHQLLGTTLRLPHETTQLPNQEPCTACWRVRIPVPRARVRTRAVTVRCAGTDVVERRYIVPHKGSLCATLLWLACAAFAALRLSPILPNLSKLTLLPLIAAGMTLGLLPSVGLHLRSLFTGKRSFRRLFLAWELAAPLTALVATLVIILPRHLVVIVTNNTKEAIPLGTGTIPPDETRPAWTWSVDAWKPAKPLIRRSEPSRKQGVRQDTLVCENNDCDHITDPGRDADIVYPRGTKLASSLIFGAGATSSYMALSDVDIKANRVAQAVGATVSLRMLPARTTEYTLQFFGDAERRVLQGTLVCKTGSLYVVRVNIESPTTEAPGPTEASGTVDTTIGKVRSKWTGPPELARACTDEPAGSIATLTLDAADGTLACTGGPIQRVLVLKRPPDIPSRSGAARPASAGTPGTRSALWMKIGPVESRWSSPTGSRIGRACLGSPGDVEIAGLVPGDPVTLPEDPVFSRVRVRDAKGTPGSGLMTRCHASDTVRTVALGAGVGNSPTFEMEAVHVERIGQSNIGVTCSEPTPTPVRDNTRLCKLEPDRLTCIEINPGPQDCIYETNSELKRGQRSERCHDPLDAVTRTGLQIPLNLHCREIYQCGLR